MCSFRSRTGSVMSDDNKQDLDDNDIEVSKPTSGNRRELNRNRKRTETAETETNDNSMQSSGASNPVGTMPDKSEFLNVDFQYCPEDNSDAIDVDNISSKENRELSRNPMHQSQTIEEDKYLDLVTEESFEIGLEVYSVKDEIHNAFSMNSIDILASMDNDDEHDVNVDNYVVKEHNISFIPNQTQKREISKRSLQASSQATSNGRLDVEEQALAWDMYDKEFQVAMRDREISLFARLKSLRQCCMITILTFMCHVALSCLFFCVWVEDWTFRDGLYFTLQTMTTVGYGTPAVPNTQIARIFVTIQMLTGIAILTVIISEVVQWAQIEASRLQFDRDNSEIAQRGLNLLRNDSAFLWNAAAEKLQSLADERSCSERRIQRFIQYVLKLSIFFNETELGRNLALCLPLVFFVLLLAVVIGPLEGWGVVDSIYFSVVTLTTVGYGEIVPTHPVSIWFSIAYMVVAVIWLSLFYVAAATYYLKLHNWNTKRIKNKLTQEMNVIYDIDMGIDDRTPQHSAHGRIDETHSKRDETHSKRDEKVSVSKSSKRRERQLTSSSEVFASMENVEKHFKIEARRTFVGRNSTNKSDFDGNLSNDSLAQDKPSLMMRAQIIKRVAIIITHEIACKTYKIEIRQNRLILEYPLTEVMEKWMIPRTARDAFQETVFNMICHVGINNLTSDNIKSLFTTPFLQVQRMVNPFIVALKNTVTMDTWITCTNILAQELEPDEILSMESIPTLSRTNSL